MVKCLWVFCFIIIACTTFKAPPLHFEDLPLISALPTETPSWHLSPQNNLYLSYISHSSDTSDELYYSKFDSINQWPYPVKVANGNQWFINWADFPSVSMFSGSELNQLSFVLQKNPAGKTYDYDIKLLLSNSSGEQFRMIDTLHAAKPGEHGFVSLLPFSFDKTMVIWLDGGDMTSDTNHTAPGDHDHGGHMKLWSALVHVNGRITNHQIIDDQVCECCQTDAVMTGRGPVVVYRNKSDKGERDIYCARYINGQWAEPKAVHEDHWKINGCPVNGPAICQDHNKIAITWYTEANGKHEVKCGISDDFGETFKRIITLPTSHSLGRLDVEWCHQLVCVSHVDKETADAEIASIKLTMLDTALTLKKEIIVSPMSPKRKSGFPRIKSLENSLYLAYTDLLTDSVPRVKSKKISWD